jgi:hypothetical protein
MLGLDAGWNCHISLDNNPTTILSDPQFELELTNNNNNNSNNMNPACTSKQSNTPGRSINRIASLYQQRKFKTNMKSLNKRLRLSKKNLHSSLPDLKFGKYISSSDKNSLNGLSSQIVKFDLSNLKSEANNRLDRTHSYRRKKLKRLSSTGSYISNDDSTNTDSVSQLQQQQQQRLISIINSNASKTNSLKTTLTKMFSINNNNNQQNQKSSINNSKFNLEDENSSHFTNHSGRTLSEAEILGNAAQLPKGVENIRHHLDNNIDNVPLHVSLFTDSSKQAITQMIEIMKDYGEIVCCLGSSHSIENQEIFATSNIS